MEISEGIIRRGVFAVHTLPEPDGFSCRYSVKGIALVFKIFFPLVVSARYHC